ncbi:hypothetical protein CKAH01_18667 [Colletotrichum kahawae]|uniref:Uncharacterized protein n=1 Tax=Colletotrichum kahawae TaxID=34407 RepID=A0AAD9Y6H3_COLKA|nr:hypothetical protein CKAH01_18667 [Colletotrichum kahawae]
MCYQIIELYNACRCLYYQHAIDRCVSYGKPGHSVQKRTIFVGYACTDHTSSPPIQIVPSLVQNVPSVGQAAPSTSEFYRNPHRALGPRLEAASSYRVPSNLPTARPPPQDRPSQQKALEEEQADNLDEECEEPSQAANYGISGGAHQRYPDKLSPSTHTGRALSQEDITKLRPKTNLPSKTGSEKGTSRRLHRIYHHP